METTYYDSGEKEREYWMLDKYIRHREDGPADIWYRRTGKKTSERWYINDKLHRATGPAETIYSNDPDSDYKQEDWMLFGHWTTKKKVEKFMSIMNNWIKRVVFYRRYKKLRTTNVFAKWYYAPDESGGRWAKKQLNGFVGKFI